MIRIEFSDEDIQQLNYERYHYPHPQVQKKMEVLYLKSQGLSHQEIRRLVQISKTTLARYLRQYQQGGIEKLKQLNYKGQPSHLNQHTQTIESYFQEQPPRTVAEAMSKIEELTGIKRSPKKLEPLLEEAHSGHRAVFFVDAAHFVHRAYLGFIWCFTRIFIPSPSGRKRFNVLGAINAVTKEVVTVTNET